MKLTITATDKPKEQEFHYELEISNKQVITTPSALLSSSAQPSGSKHPLNQL